MTVRVRRLLALALTEDLYGVRSSPSAKHKAAACLHVVGAVASLVTSKLMPLQAPEAGGVPSRNGLPPLFQPEMTPWMGRLRAASSR